MYYFFTSCNTKDFCFFEKEYRYLKNTLTVSYMEEDFLVCR